MVVKEGLFKVITAINHYELQEIETYLDDKGIVYSTLSDTYTKIVNPFVILTKAEFDKINILEFNYTFCQPIQIM